MAPGFVPGSVREFGKGDSVRTKSCGAMMINGIEFTPLQNRGPGILFPSREKLFLARM